MCVILQRIKNGRKFIKNDLLTYSYLLQNIEMANVTQNIRFLQSSVK